MYKRRISEWGLDKKHKESEMRAIVRKHARRVSDGKSSTFSVRGRTIDYDSVIRYFRRKGVSVEDVVARQSTSPTPEAVICSTPPSSPVCSSKNVNMGLLATEEQGAYRLPAIWDNRYVSTFSTTGNVADSRKTTSSPDRSSELSILPCHFQRVDHGYTEHNCSRAEYFNEYTFARCLPLSCEPG